VEKLLSGENEQKAGKNLMPIAKDPLEKRGRGLSKMTSSEFLVRMRGGAVMARRF